MIVNFSSVRIRFPSSKSSMISLYSDGPLPIVMMMTRSIAFCSILRTLPPSMYFRRYIENPDGFFGAGGSSETRCARTPLTTYRR